MKRLWIGITLFLLLISVNTYSYNRTFREVSLMEGLSDLTVNELYKDSLGFMWIGTGKALDRFDGVHLKRYDIPGTDEKLKRVNAIAELPGNELWMGNGMGLWRLDKKGDKLEAIARETIDGSVYALLYDEKDRMYIATNKGLFIYRKGVLSQMLVDTNPFSPANVVYDLDLSPDGILWMATESGLHSMSVEKNEIISYHNQEENGHVCKFMDMARVGRHIYLATQEHGIISFDTQTRTFEHYVNVGCNVISSLSADHQKMLYVGTDGNGIHFVDTSTDEVVHSVRYEIGKRDGLRSNSVYSLLVDRDGVIWVGYYQQGLDYTLYQNDLFTTYTYDSMLDTKGMPVRSIYVRGSEKLIGSRDGLYYIDEKNHRFKKYHTPQLRSGMIFCILYYQHEYYIGTFGGGMYVLNPLTLDLRNFDTEKNTFFNGQVFCIKEDADGNMWIGTSDGLFCYRGNKFVVHYTNENSQLPAGNVYEIYFDSTHKGWICTENGMCIWDASAKKLRADVFPEGFIHQKKIRVIYEDSEHQLYFAPDKGSLFQSDLSMSTFHSLQSGSLLEGKDGMFVVEDYDGWLWIGTNNGLFRYDKKGLFVPYHFMDGISNSTFTLCPPVLDEEGNLWFANSNGLLYLERKRLEREKKSPYPVLITEVKKNGPSSVTFCFSDFSYTSPASMMFEYWLEGTNSDWIPLNARSYVTYYELKQGRHSFKVRRMGEPDSETQVTFTVSSSWMYVWIYIVIAIIILLISWRFIRYLKSRGNNRAFFVVDMVDEPQHVSAEKYKTNRISQEECKRLADKLEEYMKTEKPYTNTELKIGDLAEFLGVSSHSLSYVFNQYLNCSYYDYVNDYRIAEFKRMVKTNEYSKYTLSALAELCGFSSRASFFRSFKKATGVTPNDYIRSESVK